MSMLSIASFDIQNWHSTLDLDFFLEALKDLELYVKDEESWNL